MPYNDFVGAVLRDGKIVPNRQNKSARDILQKELDERKVKNLINYVPNGELPFEYSFDAKCHIVVGSGTGQIMVALRRAFPLGVFLVNQYNVDRMYTVITDEVEYDWYEHAKMLVNIKGVKIEFKRIEIPHEGVKVSFIDKEGVKWEGLSIAKF